MTLFSQYPDTVINDLCSDKPEQRKRLRGRINALRSSNEESGLPPTLWIQYSLNRVLVDREPSGQVLKELRSKSPKSHGRHVADCVEKVLDFIPPTMGTPVKPRYMGHAHFSFGPSSVRVIPHATFVNGGLSTHIIVCSTKSVDLLPRYWGAINALGRYLFERVDAPNSQIILFDACKGRWMKRDPDYVQLNALVKNRFDHFRSILTEMGLRIATTDDDEEYLEEQVPLPRFD